MCWAGAVTTVAAAEGLQQLPGFPFPSALSASSRTWDELLGDTFPGEIRLFLIPVAGRKEKVCVPLCSFQRGCGAWEWLRERGRVLTLSRREQPE